MLTVYVGRDSRLPLGRRTDSCGFPHSRASPLSTRARNTFLKLSVRSRCSMILKWTRTVSQTFLVLGPFREAFLPGRARSKENLKLEFASKPSKKKQNIQTNGYVMFTMCLKQINILCLGENKGDLQRGEVSGLGATSWMGLTWISASFLKQACLLWIIPCTVDTFSVTASIWD